MNAGNVTKFDKNKFDLKRRVMGLWAANSWPLSDVQYEGLTMHLRRKGFTFDDLKKSVTQYVDAEGSRPPRFGGLLGFLKAAKQQRTSRDEPKARLKPMTDDEAAKGREQISKIRAMLNDEVKP